MFYNYNFYVFVLGFKEPKD